VTDKHFPSPSLLLPQGEWEASRGAQDARQFDRLRWRCRRGLLELDVILRQFLDEQYSALTTTEREAFEKLLTTSDNTLLAYMQGTEIPTEKELMQIVSKIRK
jgi:antitoxin CptB